MLKEKYSDAIIEVVCSENEISSKMVFRYEDKRTLKYLWPRNEIIYFIWLFSDENLTTIASRFGKSSHATILNSIKKSVRNRVQTDSSYYEKINSIEERIKIRFNEIFNSKKTNLYSK